MSHRISSIVGNHTLKYVLTNGIMECLAQSIARSAFEASNSATQYSESHARVMLTAVTRPAIMSYGIWLRSQGFRHPAEDL